MIEKKGAIPSEVVEKSSTLHTASFTPHPRGSGLSGEKEVLKACPQCHEVPEIGYCCGEYFIFHPSKIVGMCFCSSFTEMHSSEETEIKAWNRRVSDADCL